MKGTTAYARKAVASRDLADSGGGNLQIFLLALIAFALLDWFIL